MRYLATVTVALLVLATSVASEPVVFDDVQQQKRFQSLLEEIRCLVCQNQSLADSNADLARDLRNEVYKMVREGRSNQQVIDFLVTRYGDFVLYRPPLKNTTLILWFGPFILLLIAFASIYRFVKSTGLEQVTVSNEEKSRLSRILGDNSKE